MAAPKWLPGPAEIGRETLILIAGALLAALVMHNWPEGRAYVKSAWQG